MILKFEEFLNEAKNIGLLYHYTSFERLIDIIADNILYSNKYYKENKIGSHDLMHQLSKIDKDYFISTTRNKNYHIGRSGNSVRQDIQIVLDGNKLTNKYKVKPITMYPIEDIINIRGQKIKRNLDKSTKEGQWKDEQEERVLSKYIKNFNKYILKINLVEDDLSKLSNNQKSKVLEILNRYNN